MSVGAAIGEVPRSSWCVLAGCKVAAAVRRDNFLPSDLIFKTHMCRNAYYNLGGGYCNFKNKW